MVTILSGKQTITMIIMITMPTTAANTMLTKEENRRSGKEEHVFTTYLLMTRLMTCTTSSEPRSLLKHVMFRPRPACLVKMVKSPFADTASIGYISFRHGDNAYNNFC